jgi:hypothetical protein
VSDTDLLVGLLAAEHAAVYAYGVLGARLDEATRDLALRAFDAHRELRSSLTTLLQALGADAPGPLAAYDVSARNRAQALGVAVDLEVKAGVLWRDLVAATEDPALRALGVEGLAESAVRAARWRRVAGLRPLTEPFPGKT